MTMDRASDRLNLGERIDTPALTEYGGSDPHVRITWSKATQSEKGRSLRAINKRLSANWPAIVRAVKANTRRLTGRDAL